MSSNANVLGLRRAVVERCFCAADADFAMPRGSRPQRAESHGFCAHLLCHNASARVPAPSCDARCLTHVLLAERERRISCAVSGARKPIARNTILLRRTSLQAAAPIARKTALCHKSWLLQHLPGMRDHDAIRRQNANTSRKHQIPPLGLEPGSLG
jgi:hypothetical protein